MKKYSLVIRQKKSKIRICKCGIKFIEIQAEIDMGYKRRCCPWCVCYKTGRKPPPITNKYIPHGMTDEWDCGILDI